MLVIVIMIPRIIQVIAILSLCDLMIPAIPMPKMSTPTIIGNIMPKFNNNNKLLSIFKYGGHSASMMPVHPHPHLINNPTLILM